MLARAALCVMAMLLTHPARSAETCHYTGTASHGARIVVDTVSAARDWLATSARESRR